MTPASFVKLTLRMLIAYIMLISLPSKISLIALSTVTFLRSGSAGFNSTEGVMWLLIIFMMAVLIVVSLWAWLCTDWLSQRLLPAGASFETAADYQGWESAGLRFIGGWLAVLTCLGFQGLLFGHPVSADNPALLLFHLTAAFFLLIGWDKLGSLFFRSAHKT